MHFEPTISSQEGTPQETTNTCRFRIEEGALAGRTFTARPRICPNPCCPCGVVGLDCRDEEVARPAGPSLPGGSPASFDLEVFERKLRPGNKPDPDGLALGRAFVAEAKPEQWEWLQRLFMRTKAWHMQTMDLDSLEVQFPPEVLAGEGTMVGYAEIFPWCEAFVFTRDGEEWFVEDQYSVAPACKCTGTVLAFFRPSAASDQADGPMRCATALRYDYVSGKTELLEAQTGSPPLATLMQALRAAHPDLTDTLRQRHKQLHRLARRLLPKSRSRARRLAAQAANLDGEGDDEPTQTPVPTVQTAPKVGRNDPCPCGSGKKYKKCCGAPPHDRAVQA